MRRLYENGEDGGWYGYLIKVRIEDDEVIWEWLMRLYDNGKDVRWWDFMIMVRIEDDEDIW